MEGNEIEFVRPEIKGWLDNEFFSAIWAILDKYIAQWLLLL